MAFFVEIARGDVEIASTLAFWLDFGVQTRQNPRFDFPDLPGDAFCNIPVSDDSGLPEARNFASRRGSGREKSGISSFREKVPPGPEKARYTRAFLATWCQNARVNAISRKKRVHSRVLARFAPYPRHFFSKLGNSRFGSFRAARGRPGASKTCPGGVTEKRRKSRKRTFFKVFAKIDENRRFSSENGRKTRENQGQSGKSWKASGNVEKSTRNPQNPENPGKPQTSPERNQGKPRKNREIPEKS